LKTKGNSNFPRQPAETDSVVGSDDFLEVVEDWGTNFGGFTFSFSRAETFVVEDGGSRNPGFAGSPCDGPSGLDMCSTTVLEDGRDVEDVSSTNALDDGGDVDNICWVTECVDTSEESGIDFPVEDVVRLNSASKIDFPDVEDVVQLNEGILFFLVSPCFLFWTAPVGFLVLVIPIISASSEELLFELLFSFFQEQG